MVGMSEEKGLARPRQVTMAVVIAVVGSLVLVIGLFDTLGRLRTPDMRDAVDEFLSEAPGSTLGIDTAQVIDMMRTLAFVSGALAAMCLVFAVYVMQRHRGARIGFTVVAALLVLTVPVAGLMPFFLAVAAFLLWLQPSRDWFVGRAPAPAGAATALPLLSHVDPGPERRPDPEPADPTGPAEPGAQPPPQAGSWGQPTYGPPPYPQSYGQSYGQSFPPPGYPPAYAASYPVQGQQYPPMSGPSSDKRPLTVTVAAVLTWLGAGTTALLMVAFVGLLAVGGDAFVDEFDRAARESDVAITSDQALAAGWVIAVAFLAWSLIAIVLGILAFRRSNAGRIMLVVSAVMTALFSLVAITSLVSLVTLILGVATVVLLFTGGANQWYSRRTGSGYPPAGVGYPVHNGQPDPQLPPPGNPAPPKRNQPW
jgi:hypothetical protein